MERKGLAAHMRRIEREFAQQLPKLADKVASTLAIVGVVFGASFFFEKARNPPSERPSLEQRIKLLTESLNTSARTITEIEDEVAARQKLVAKLKADAETAQALASMNQKQTEAIAQALRGQLEQQERSSFWKNIWLNVFFAVLGVVLSEGYRWLVRFIRKRKASTTQTA